MNAGKSIYREISRIDIRLKPQDYSRDVLKVICKNHNFSFGSIILVDEKGVGSMFAAYNLPENYPNLVHGVSAPVLSSPSGIVVKTGEILAVNDILAEPRLSPWHELLMYFDVKTIVWIPLISEGKAFGTYNLYDTNKRKIEGKEKEILLQLSVIFSMAIISSEYIEEIQEKNFELEKEIFERKRVERKLREAKERAEAADMAKSEFLANMSHEIRTPMNAILGFVDLLLQEEEEPGKKEILNIVGNSGERLMSIINSILYLTEIEADRFSLEKEAFSLRKLLLRLSERFTMKVKEQDVEFTINIDNSVPSSVLGDKDKVELIVYHIVDNAFKFTETGSITVDCGCEPGKGGGTISIAVKDTGIGIPKEKQDMIFSIFTQADSSSTRRFSGAGLGLAIAGKLVAMMSGKIDLESEEGVGSTFTIELELPEVTAL
jgi:signal transduction histidine kinase